MKKKIDITTAANFIPTIMADEVNKYMEEMTHKWEELNKLFPPPPDKRSWFKKKTDLFTGWVGNLRYKLGSWIAGVDLYDNY